VLEHQAEFVNALRSGKMRERLFDTMEQYCAHDFGNGRAGKGFYEQLLSAVRAAGSPEAIKEFETRFSPFLNPHQKHLNAGDVGHLEGITDPEVTTAVQDRPRSEWGRVFALYLAAFLGAFIIGLTVIGMTPTEQSMTAATIPRAKAAEGTTTQPMQVVGVKALEPETTPRAAEPSHQWNRKRESPVFSQEGEVRFQETYVHQNGGISPVPPRNGFLRRKIGSSPHSFWSDVPHKVHSNIVFQRMQWRFCYGLRLFPEIFAHRVAFVQHMPEHQHTQLIGVPAPQRVDDLLMFPHRLAQPVAANQISRIA
jgi:hypothetical protein